MTGNPEVIGSSVGLVPTNAHVTTQLSTSIDWPEAGMWEVRTMAIGNPEAGTADLDHNCTLTQ
jgi:hypothetical protein